MPAGALAAEPRAGRLSPVQRPTAQLSDSVDCQPGRDLGLRRVQAREVKAGALLDQVWAAGLAGLHLLQLLASAQAR